MVPVRINRDVSVIHPGTPIIKIDFQIDFWGLFCKFPFCEPNIVIGCSMVVILKKWNKKSRNFLRLFF